MAPRDDALTLRSVRARRSLSATVAAGAALALSACASSGDSNGNTTGPGNALAIQEGATQSATVGQQVSTKPAVKVTKGGSPAAGVSVTFAVASGGGTITGATQTTGSDGIARVGGWTLGNTAGDNSVTATSTGATGSPVTFTATGTAGPPANLVKAGGDAQNSAAGVALTTRPAVKITDAFGNAVAGVTVNFVVASGGGSVTGGSQVTGADGVATVGGWTLGQTIGTNTLSATSATGSPAGSPALFTATGVVGPIAALLKVAGDNQTANINTAVPVAPSVRVTDAFGNNIANAPVTFSVLTGGGILTGATPSTLATGVATIGSWTLGVTLGQQTLRAAAGTATATFTATGITGFNANRFLGTFTGSWRNNTFATTGPASMTVTTNATLKTMTVAISVTQSVIAAGAQVRASKPGQSDGVSRAATPVNFTITAPYTTQGVEYEGPAGNYGTADLSFFEGGNFTIDGSNHPNANIASWTATGQMSGSLITINYTVFYIGGGTSSGTITMTNP